MRTAGQDDGQARSPNHQRHDFAEPAVCDWGLGPAAVHREQLMHEPILVLFPLGWCVQSSVYYIGVANHNPCHNIIQEAQI